MNNVTRLIAAAIFTSAAGAVLAADPVLKNGTMTQGFDAPADWKSEGGGKVVRDTQIFKEGPSSLRVESNEKSTQGWQELRGGSNAKIKVAGWMRSEGGAKAQVFVHAFAEGFRQNQFQQVKFLAGAHDWTSFEKEVSLPEWTTFFRIGLMVENGSAWLDEVRLGDGPADPGKPQSESERRLSGPPAKALPSVPGWGFYPQFPGAWQAHFDRQLERTKRGGIDLLFIGDSITQGWADAGKATWDRVFAPRRAENYGIGGDSTRQVLWRLEHGLVAGLAPRVVVLKIGTNNLYDDHNSGSDDEIAAGVAACVRKLRAKLPETPILLCAILPRQNEYFSGRVARVNGEIQRLADGTTIHWLDMTDAFQVESGRVRAELFVPDQLHLSAKGYEVWATQLEPALKKVLR